VFRDRQFLLEVRTIAVPITIQSLVMSLLLTVDQLMVGQLGEGPVASVGIASKITGIVTVVLAGLATGTSIFCAQYWGRGERDRIRHVLGFGLAVGLGFSGIMAALVGGFPSVVMSPFTTDAQVLLEGGRFVRILALSYVPTMLTMIYSAVLRSTGQVRLLMYASITAVGVNVLLDYLLIFGRAGLPRMGLTGAALATTIARCVEFGLVIGPAYVTRHVVAVRRLGQLRGTDRALA
jgi:Na+-driven multidrug efflux pump